MNGGKVVAVVGTPGVGKTTLCSFLSRRYGYEHVEVGRLISAKKLYSGYDEKRGVPIADIKALRKEVRSITSRRDLDLLLLDGHYAHELISRSDTLGVFVMRSDPLRLFRRALRLYSMRKARENSISEFLGTVAFEARQMHDRVVDSDVTRLTVTQAATKLRSYLVRRAFGKTPPIDWTKVMSGRRLRRFLRVVEAQVLLG